MPFHHDPFAQTSGEVTGRISDATGAAVPAARISLTNTATNAVRETISTDSGDNTFAAVAPGIYKIQVEQPRRFHNGFSVIGSYTWSKSIDTTSGIRNQGFDTLYPQNSYCLACELGRSAFDTRQRIVTSVLYDLPVGKGKTLDITNRFANTIIGGWKLGGILTLQSGMPGTLTIGGADNASAAAGGYDRPNATGVTPYLENRAPSVTGTWTHSPKRPRDSSAT
ncbi:MAG TPA: carboxypeptidase-like regulatory domain-containing protein [Candidatus Acidoferrales bacterium]|jgi:hypothetical protein|nr:carboxypeptidase-like regulatory domain-containing protein [Candidatus Acidoferrales bacterium]